jgi:asparagine synthase (glutamine-hydrolysing)
MSGFAVIFNGGNQLELKTMIDAIRHRGSYLAGYDKYYDMMMAQNYLRADITPDKKRMPKADSFMVPISDPDTTGLKICYDGQVGNWKKMAQKYEVEDGPYREERLLLKLYRKYNVKMFEHLEDAVFAFVISDGKNILAARDLLGIKPLFIGLSNNTLYLCSELKGITKITDEVYEFPPGKHMDHMGRLTSFTMFPKRPPKRFLSDVNDITATIRDIIDSSFHSRIDFNMETGCLLSGGISSSVIGFIASESYRKKFGKKSKLKTYTLGVGETEDIISARMMSDYINSDHYELIIDLEEMIKILPKVIYYLESFDPSLVRSAASNYLISKHAKETGIEILLSGEGADEIFCGYQYLKKFPAEELFTRQMECIKFLHNNASLRLDRMNHCSSLRVIAPLISNELLNYALSIPPEYKQKPNGDQKIEKWIFRKAFEDVLPKEIVWRLKKEFSQGSGSANVLPEYFAEVINDVEFLEEKQKFPLVRSKEELFYFRLFTEYFNAEKAVDTVGQWISP